MMNQVLITVTTLSWLGLLLACLLGGIAAIVIGRRGRRVNDHPICRACGFDVVGIAAGGSAARCPECGADLNGRRATRIGRRERSSALIVVGAVLLSLSLLLIGVGV